MLIKIQSWLLQPKVWRLVCFVSSIVGLVCYALSSSFNHLYGNWTWWKIFLYIVLSFFVSLAVLSAKAWEYSTSRCLEAHTAFFILLVTSVYSFFFDKEVKGKPDAYSLLSSAAFAIMSLCLSRLSHLGFEDDLLYFFSGVLTVQLMKIKPWLVIVGGSFSYSLIILRSALNALPRTGYLGLSVQDQVVIEIVSHSQGTSHTASQADSPQEVDATPENEGLGFTVTQVVSRSQQSTSDSDNNINIKTRFIGCIETLKKENGNIIDAISKHVDGYFKASEVEIHADNNLVVDALPLGIINDLQETAWLMLTTEFEEDCWRGYSSCRREFLKECIWTFGLQIQELKTEDVDKIEKVRCWLKKALHVADNILFPNERRLCDRIFKGASFYADIAFREVSMELMISLLRIANHLTTFLDSKSFAYCRGGQLHPNIRELMEKICLVCLRRDSRFKQEFEKYTMVDKEGKLSPSVHVARIIITELLERILEAGSKNYDNNALGYVFVMNNLSYIEREANLYGLVPVFGHDWLRKNTIKLKQNLELYQRSSWNKIVDLLKLDINDSEPDVATELLKDKLRSFNKHFDEICNVQSTWFVFDEQSRELIIKSIENILLPAYGNFIGRFQDFLGKHANEYIKYGILEIQDRVNNLFHIGECMSWKLKRYPN
ncbi:hypothetical protein Fmac_031297 [Flemingia macrophylla]|uniref:Exocyst subunit Exo70 family protein n=1 Tax=Flemingia macrophylla TaxID=520843 RepID=A0ABD1L1N5_9FABA